MGVFAIFLVKMSKKLSNFIEYCIALSFQIDHVADVAIEVAFQATFNNEKGRISVLLYLRNNSILISVTLVVTSY